MWRWLKKRRRRKLIILIDYENVSKEAISEGKILDLDAIVRQCVEIGDIELAHVFAPMHLVSALPPHTNEKGFYVIACPGKNGKEKDRVDTIMIELGIKLINTIDNLTDVVIVSRDGDFCRLANHARFHGKRVIAIAGDEISFILKQVVDLNLPIPVKSK